MIVSKNKFIACLIFSLLILVQMILIILWYLGYLPTNIWVILIPTWVVIGVVAILTLIIVCLLIYIAVAISLVKEDNYYDKGDNDDKED